MAFHDSGTSAALAGRTIVITRPAGTAGGLVRRVRAAGGIPVLLPGLSLRGLGDAAALRAALADEVLVFTSPAAVRFAARLAPLRTRALVLAVGHGTARALARLGVAALVPARQDSEGVLGLEATQHLAGRRVALIGAPGGRGVLREQLVSRGAQLRELHVYCRVPPRLDRRHAAAIDRLPRSARVLLSSAEALGHLMHLLPPVARAHLCAAVAVVSSERLAQAAQEAGFRRSVLAASANAADLLAAAARP
ncbi:MAG: uroporphyrinogen-III synthase [Rhodanobacter sp.]|nr:MAG: uroporphyrinogen-III synthase [Rhodanobacter sp.]TAM15157.1 MAG: uroporphyrinogen-III synthase [Rhodanobacter sp.]TAM36373.1 MAG: uroporphyrinogen-III synthase [Rhodanobacter sp.]